MKNHNYRSSKKNKWSNRTLVARTSPAHMRIKLKQGGRETSHWDTPRQECTQSRTVMRCATDRHKCSITRRKKRTRVEADLGLGDAEDVLAIGPRAEAARARLHAEQVVQQRCNERNNSQLNIRREPKPASEVRVNVRTARAAASKTLGG